MCAGKWFPLQVKRVMMPLSARGVRVLLVAVRILTVVPFLGLQDPPTMGSFFLWAQRLNHIDHVLNLWNNFM